jgi:beta-lactamase regulating signal transducer with metallopeptidase domain
VEILAESAVRATVLAFGVAIVLRILRIRSPRMAHDVWTIVVLVMLLLPAIVARGPEFALPLLPSNVTRTSLAQSAADVTEWHDAPAQLGVTTASSATPRRQRATTWTSAAVSVYFAGVGVLLMRLAIGWRQARRIRRDAVDVHGRLTHPACVTPMTVGILTPMVILPPDWASWDEEEVSAVLAHEEEHARRRDPLVAAVALLNRAIFWFHPLAWWLPREIARLSERACDDVVMARGHDSDVYSACLVRFARRATEAGGRIAPTAMAMPGAGLRERLGMLSRPLARPSHSRVACAAGACAALVLLCAAATPAQSGAGVGQLAWRVETSAHFEIVHPSLPDDRLAAAIADAEAAYEHLSAALKYDMPRRVTLVLVPRDRDVDAAAQGSAVVPSGDVNGQRLVISLESLDRRTRAVVHDLTHQFAFDIIPATSRLSPFLIEGLAEHQRGAWGAQDLELIRNDVAAGAFPSVTSLGPTDRHWAHAVFDFVAAQDGAEGVRRLLFALRARETLAQALPMALGVTPDQFDQAFRGYVTSRFGQR